MEALAAYGDSDEEALETGKLNLGEKETAEETHASQDVDKEQNEGHTPVPPVGSSVQIQDLAPAVDLSLESNPYYVKTDTKVVYHNPLRGYYRVWIVEFGFVFRK